MQTATAPSLVQLEHKRRWRRLYCIAESLSLGQLARTKALSVRSLDGKKAFGKIKCGDIFHSNTVSVSASSKSLEVRANVVAFLY